MAKKLELQEGEVFGVLFSDVEAGVKPKKLIKVFQGDKNNGSGVFHTKLKTVKKGVISQLKSKSKESKKEIKEAERNLKEAKATVINMRKSHKLVNKQLSKFSKV